MSHKDLLERMRRNGMTRVSMAPAGSFQVYVDDPNRNADQTAYLMDRGPISLPNTAIVYRHADEESARKSAGRYQDGCFQWGVFVFHCDRDCIDKFRRAVVGR